IDNNEKFNISDSLFNILKESNLNTLEETIKRLFELIDYNNFTKSEILNYEGFYASVLIHIFQHLN
ncbi:MAG: hypothetical protein HRT40_06035, partial [Campylobacteraceae bacterium]|nr:hypothetical protein [Campylobacteraceae bacterium]